MVFDKTREARSPFEAARVPPATRSVFEGLALARRVRALPDSHPACVGDHASPSIR